MRINWDGAMRALVLVRLGQELGSDSRAARLVHDVLDVIVSVPLSVFF